MKKELTLREGDIVFADSASIAAGGHLEAMRVEFIHGEWATCIVESDPKPRFAEYPVASLIRTPAHRAGHHTAAV